MGQTVSREEQLAIERARVIANYRDNRLGYTNAEVELRERGENIVAKGVVATDYAATYRSPPNDLLIYDGCVSFPDLTVFEKPPCFLDKFEAPDDKLRQTIASKLKAKAGDLGNLEGPISVFIYRNFDDHQKELGAPNAREWFKRNNHSYPELRESLRAIPLMVYMFYASLKPNGKPATLAEAGVAHAWLRDFTYVPASSISNSHLMQCFTYCLDEKGQFFPCGCKWRGECQAKATSSESIGVRRVFFGAYTVNLQHPWVAPLFEKSQYRQYQQSVLPMWIELFSNCRYNLVSQNGDYMLAIGKDRATIYRRSNASTDFKRLCRGGDVRNYRLSGCKESNRMCASASKAVSREYLAMLSNVSVVQKAFVYNKPATRAAYMILTQKKVSVLEESSDAVLWEWDFSSIIPEKDLVYPIAVRLKNNGELSIFNALNEEVGSVSRGVSTKVETRPQAPTESTAEYERLMRTILDDRWQNETRMETAVRVDGASVQCSPPPFQFMDQS